MNTSTTVSLPVGLLLQVDELAKAYGITRSALIQRYIKEGIQRINNEKSK